jgi:hypothetical protein
MKEKKKNDQPADNNLAGSTPDPKQGFRPDEKASIGGAYNSGVTSDDPEEKKQIEKKGSMGKKQPGSAKEKKDKE